MYVKLSFTFGTHHAVRSLVPSYYICHLILNLINISHRSYYFSYKFLSVVISVQLNHSSLGGDEKCQLDYVNANFELNSLWFLLPLVVWLTVLFILSEIMITYTESIYYIANIRRPVDVTNYTNNILIYQVNFKRLNMKKSLNYYHS